MRKTALKNNVSKRLARPCLWALFHFLIFMLPVTGLSFLLQAASHSGEKIIRAVWNIHNKNGTGTAWAVGPSHVITNAHVFQDLTKRGATRIFLSQKDRDASISIERAIKISTTYDLALLKTRERMTHYLPIANGFSIDQDQPLYAIGYPKEFFQVTGQSERITYENHFP